ncbi:MAG: hypothetical protein GX775_02265 [Erysipelothrix sp.]|nr:hypothetical protein [Erysipelothrix sp.]
MLILTLVGFIVSLGVATILEMFVLSNLTSNPFTLILYWSIHALLVMIIVEALVGLFAKRTNLAGTKEVFKMLQSAHKKDKKMTWLILASLLCLVISYVFLSLTIGWATNVALILCIVLFIVYVVKLFKLENKVEYH